MADIPNFNSDEEWVDYYLALAPPMTPERWGHLERLILEGRRQRIMELAVQREARRLANVARREAKRQSDCSKLDAGTCRASAKA